mmetsp:Transcript_19938/g.32847  ORF Transcript_19938/g.32847 Transcript_19938/m.32847 type:complete len:547 (+) Transcript_19938:1775-3415(+)
MEAELYETKFAEEEDEGDTPDIPLSGGGSRMLSNLGLGRNPYVDRTAEKTMLRTGAFYLHSDLQGFVPSDTTYIFFGKRGSGKTTIRLMMMQRYKEFNKKRTAEGKGPLFVVDLCRPGYMNECLKCFMRTIKVDKDNWDANFADSWTSNDLADCIVSFAINDMMRRVVNGSAEGKMILNSLAKNPRSATQFLLLSHLYTRECSATLFALRDKVLPIAMLGTVKTVLGIAAVGAAIAGAAFAWKGTETGKDTAVSTPAAPTKSSVEPPLVATTGYDYSQYIPHISQSTLTWTTLAVCGVLSGVLTQRKLRANEQQRAEELCKPLRIADSRVDLMKDLLNSLFSADDTADRIRGLYIGHSAQQKLELIDNLSKACGFKGLAVFGDCFDEVGLLDPLMYPGALKVFAREVCRNEVLNQGRLHFFFPDARASLDLSTDRIVREARFDRHFVRDLTWSRFQLEDLAERRFIAAQTEAGVAEKEAKAKFQDLFKHVSKEDFSGAISKLATPRELMVFMTELLARVEANSEEGQMVAAQDMEIAVTKAQEQSV